MPSSRRQFVRTLVAATLWSLSAAPLRVVAQSAADGSAPELAVDPAASLAGFGAAEWMRIPRIGVDAHVSDIGISDGFYDVPWFDVGHHSDSHPPGEQGNSIFNGHVATLNAGDVFRRLNELNPGDATYVYTSAYRLDWVVQEVFSVAAEDSSFLLDTDVARLTLYTCTGRFNPIERSFAERLVVVAELVDVTPRG
jgi:LPXTG-site transpeptidase (sortase) family protein